MNEKIRKIPEKFLEFWNKYTSKQKTIITLVLAGVIFALAVLIVWSSQTKYVELATFEDTADTAEAKSVLEGEGIKLQLSDDGLTISVDEEKISDARLALGENGISEISTADYSSLFDNSMSTTDSERNLKVKLYLQSEMETDIATIDGIQAASVQINIPDSSNTIYKNESEASASIMLITSDDISEDVAYSIATYVANRLGNKNTDNIRIIDQTGTLLFSGEDTTTSANVNNILDVREQVTTSFENKVRSLLIDSNIYSDAEVMANLSIDLDEEEILDTMYYSNDEDDTGPKDSLYTYSAENVDGSGGVVGTDSNGEEITDYDLYDEGYGEATVTVVREEYSTSSTVTNRKKAVGTIDTANSSIAIVLSKYVIYDEEKMEEQGLLKDISFEEFEAQNREKVLIEVDEDLYSAVQMATGIKESNISILAYEVPLFYPKESSGFNVVNYFQIFLAVLIVIMLIVVVFKGMKPVEVTELEPELSVEALLATTKENQTLEDIEFSDKSATNQQVEKFVDENPEAVAALLRNWLNDDWE